MNKAGVVISALALLLLLAGGIGTAGAATPGFAVYKVTVSAQGYSSHSITINETVAATSNPDSDNLILTLVAGNLTSTYTRSINSSSEVSPFIPSITNQTLTTTYDGGTVAASIVKSGSAQMQFQGASRSLTVYTLEATGTVNGSSSSLQGTLATFQSGLVYSVNITATVPYMQSSWPQLTGNLSIGASALPSGGATAQGNLAVTLLSTSLPLSAGNASSSTQAVSAGIGAGVAASAVAVGLGVRRHSKHSDRLPEEKPDHWVD